MQTKIATGIDTEIFYSIIRHLISTGWRISIEYSNQVFDKGIDFDLYQLTKNQDTILFVWTNWFEGELKATDTLIATIEKELSIQFTFGEPENLKQENILEKMKPLLEFK